MNLGLQPFPCQRNIGASMEYQLKQVTENQNQKRITFGNKEHTKSRKSETPFN